MVSVDDLFPGFSTATVAADGIEIFTRSGGSGPPVLCLHGYPQTHTMWHRIAPELARDFTVVVADLRGYGQSSAPADTADHDTYTKRAMAADMVAVMRAHGHARFAVVGHDRGARVAYRMALDHPKTVTRVVSVDVIPTLDVWETINQARMMRLYHWAFLAQPAPLPETWIGHNPAGWVAQRVSRGAPTLPEWFDPRVLAHDQACFSEPARLAASCADYRAGATRDVDHDRADRDSGHRIAAPLAVYWGTRGNLVDGPDPIATWTRWCEQPVTGSSIPAGHFVPQENPDALIAALRRFLSAETDPISGD
ncbi:MAG: alpha/beta hydrolase [Pseudomonadota bacterium]